MEKGETTFQAGGKACAKTRSCEVPDVLVKSHVVTPQGALREVIRLAQ